MFVISCFVISFGAFILRTMRKLCIKLEICKYLKEWTAIWWLFFKTFYYPESSINCILSFWGFSYFFSFLKPNFTKLSISTGSKLFTAFLVMLATYSDWRITIHLRVETRFREPRFSEIINLMNELQLPFSYFTQFIMTRFSK